MAKTHKKIEHPASSTPMSDELERTRVALGQARTPAYGDALRLCRRLERQLQAKQDKHLTVSAA